MRRPVTITPERLLTISVICFVLALVCFGFLLAGCASSTTGKALNVGVGLAATADYVTTRQAIQSGRAHEANPLMGQGALRQAALKGLGVSSVMAVASLAERKGKPILSHVVRSAAIVIWSAASLHNYSVAHVRHGGR